MDEKSLTTCPCITIHAWAKGEKGKKKSKEKQRKSKENTTPQASEKQVAASKNGIGGDRRSGDSIWQPATGHQPHKAEATAGAAGRATSTSLTLFQLWPCVAKQLQDVNAR